MEERRGKEENLGGVKGWYRLVNMIKMHCLHMCNYQRIQKYCIFLILRWTVTKYDAPHQPLTSIDTCGHTPAQAEWETLSQKLKSRQDLPMNAITANVLSAKHTDACTHEHANATYMYTHIQKWCNRLNNATKGMCPMIYCVKLAWLLLMTVLWNASLSVAIKIFCGVVNSCS